MKCRVPMWVGLGIPAGLCGREAYGKGRNGSHYGWVTPACPPCGGPTREEISHQGDPCKSCKTPHDDVPVGPCKDRAVAEGYDYAL